MNETVKISLSDLILDRSNARLPEAERSEAEARHALADIQGRKLVTLARDIVEHGLDPTALPAVVATTDSKKRYVVLEGNRRVLALKALETPALVIPALSSTDQSALYKLSERFAENPIAEIECVLFDSEEEADHWIDLRHTGANEGAGLVEWGPEEKDRRNRRKGKAQKAGEVLEFLDRMGVIEDSGGQEQRRVLTNIERLLSTPDARRSLGLDSPRGSKAIVSNYNAEETSRVLGRVVERFQSGELSVKDIYSADDRRAFAKDLLPKADRPRASERLPAPVRLSELTPGGKSKGPAATARRAKARRRRRERERTTLIPKSCDLDIAPPRINDVYTELLELDVDTFRNAGAVLFRVFVEQSVNHELGARGLADDKELRDWPLSKKIKVLAKDMHDKDEISRARKSTIEAIANSKGSNAISVTTFNQFVHNETTQPRGSELRMAWDDLQEFFEVIWG